jgi:hypothetical protein
MDHFWDKPMVFVKAFIGMSRDNVLLGKSFKQITAIPNRGWKKAICAVLYPVGWLLSRKFVGSI